MARAGLLIGGTLVGAGQRPFIIAELSGNHNGSLERAFAVVRAAAASGADAIKLQTFTQATLTIDSDRPEFFIDSPGGLWHGRRLWDLYAEAHTPWEWHRPLFKAARAMGLECVSTAYDLASLDFLLSIGVDAVKIASFEVVHLPLIEAAARSGRVLLVSTGMATAQEVDDAVGTIRGNNCEHFVLLKCTSAYPSEGGDANLLTMFDMARRYECDIGFSDHMLRPHAAFAATALGAAVIEKHLTLARADGGVDSGFSIEPNEFRDLVEGCRLIFQSRGEVTYGPRPAERSSLNERPSIYVVRGIKKGEAFTAEHLRIIRPANGLAPKHYGSLIGVTCVRDVEPGVPMSWEFVGREDA